MTHATPDELDARADDLEQQARNNRAVGLPSHTQAANARTLRSLAAEARQYKERTMPRHPSEPSNVIAFPAHRNRRVRLNDNGVRAVKALPTVLGEPDEAFAMRVVAAYVRGCGE